MLALGKPASVLRKLPAFPGLLCPRPQRFFGQYSLRHVPKSPKKSAPEPEFGPFKPERTFKFDQNNETMLYVYTHGHPQRVVYLLILACGLCLYQICFRWETSGFPLNALAAILVVPVSLMTFVSINRMRKAIKIITINREGTMLRCKGFAPLARYRKIPISSILSYKVRMERPEREEVVAPGEEAEEVEDETEYQHTFIYDKGNRGIFMTYAQEERAFVADADLLRAVMNRREVDFSNSPN